MTPSKNKLLAKYGEERIFVIPFEACKKIPDGYKSGKENSLQILINVLVNI